MEQEKNHWEKIYQTKLPGEVSWTQTIPNISLDFIHSFQLPKTARIIDIGGGDSRLVDFLLEEGYYNLTVLDISRSALESAKKRLGKLSEQVTWIEQEIISYQASGTFDLWHDRAAFHFFTSEDQVDAYISVARKSIQKGGYAIIGTFSDMGPDRCSGLPVRRYDEKLMTEAWREGFQKIKCRKEVHLTPLNINQEFIFCSFRRKEDSETY